MSGRRAKAIRAVLRWAGWDGHRATAMPEQPPFATRKEAKRFAAACEKEERSAGPNPDAGCSGYMVLS